MNGTIIIEDAKVDGVLVEGAHMFMANEPRVDAWMKAQDNPNHPTFWEIRLLPYRPQCSSHIVAQKETREEAIAFMCDYVNGERVSSYDY